MDKFYDTSGKYSMIGIVMTVLWFLVPFTTSIAQERNFLISDYPYSFLESQLQNPEDWVPFPSYKNRNDWRQLPEKLQELLIQKGEKALDYDWNTLTATLYLRYARDGNRTDYQYLYFERRRIFHDLLIAELIEGEGRFLDQIVNGIWAICEESSWCIPAHIGLQEKGFTALPRFDENVVDLFSAETGATIAWAYYFLKEELNTITPEISRRMKYEVDRRILDPVMSRDDYWWMGLEDQSVNNWNPWIISNWITVALLMEEDANDRSESIFKAMKCLDRFINAYPADGGCDEGPGYWGHAAGSMFDALELLFLSTEGKLSLYEKPLIRKMGAYIYKVYIHDEYFINFADASAVINLNNDLVFRYGERIQDGTMMGFAAYNLHSGDIGEYYSNSYLTRALFSLFSYQEIQDYPSGQPLLGDFFLPDLQVFGARSEAGSPEGFFLAAKGGHNDESHNHNDVGNFIVYYNGFPAIIDIGVENYSRKTFSNERYTIWTMQSAYHNLPTINGSMQNPGRTFRADQVKYNKNGNTITFELDIANAYPPEAAVSQWHRKIHFQKKRGIHISEKYSFDTIPSSYYLSFISAIPVESKAEQLILDGTMYEDPFRLIISFDKLINIEIEDIEVEDSRLQQAWGNHLHRVKIKMDNAGNEGNLSYNITRGDL